MGGAAGTHRSVSRHHMKREGEVVGRYHRTSTLRLLVLAVLFGLVTAGCGGSAGEDDGAGTSSEASSAAGGEAEADDQQADAEPTKITFLIAPDPLLDFMTEEGILDEYQERYNFELLRRFEEMDLLVS